MNTSAITYRLLSDDEQHIVLPLLGRCFPAYWEQLALTTNAFPFREISFGAFCDGQLAGHCGVIPYRISDGTGRHFSIGGIASVAVDPAYRMRGIARNLCLTARSWGPSQGYHSLTLYTAFTRVYESAGWQNYDSTPVRQVVFGGTSSSPITPHPIQDCTCKERSAIIELYDHGEDFPGKVIRSTDDAFASWRRIFGEPDFTTAVLPGEIYAIFCDGALIELYFSPDTPPQSIVSFLNRTAAGLRQPFLSIHQPPQSRLWKILREEGCVVSPSDADVMHGEHAMILDLTTPPLHGTTRLYYPIVDKF